MLSLIRFAFITAVLITNSLAVAQESSPARTISPLDCVLKGKVKKKNIVQCGESKFQISQKGLDAYNQFGISHDTTIFGAQVGSFIFRSIPTQEGIDNGQYSKKMHFDIYDYGNLNGNKERELIKAGDTVYVTFLVKFPTVAPTPTTGSRFDNDDPKYRRSLFFQFWPGGVATHFNSYRANSPEAIAGKFGYVTVMTADYGTDNLTISEKYEVERDQWYRMYFQYSPDVKDGKIFASMAPCKKTQLAKDMTQLIQVNGNTLYATKSNRRMLPTFGHYHWGGCPNLTETQFTEIEVSKTPMTEFKLPIASK